MLRHTAAIALGSNLPSRFGERAANLHEALARLAPLGTVEAVSPFFDTAPELVLDQPRFLNAAALLSTDLVPLDLLRHLLAIEAAMGRDRSQATPKGPRIIDLDLLLYDDLVLETPALTLPHPGLTTRAFVLAPLAAIAPNWRHPPTGKIIAELLRHLT